MRFIMTKDAIENYGEEWREVVLEVTHTAHAYMPAKEFFEQGKPHGYHPGYDGAGVALYDLKRVDNGEPLNMSLYRWELLSVGG